MSQSISYNSDAMIDMPIVSIDLHLFEGVRIPAEIERGSDVLQMMNFVPRALTQYIVEKITSARRSPAPYYLTGPGGVGKSTILFMVAASILKQNRELTATSCSAAPSYGDPILVVYISNSNRLVTLSSEDCCMELCHMFVALNPSFETLGTIASDASVSPLQRWNSVCAQIRQQRIKSIILIDQWNAIMDAYESLALDHPMRKFYTISTELGFSLFVGAVSSSFSPIDVNRAVFSDGEVGSARKAVEPLTIDECKMLRDIWSSRSPPVHVDDALLTELHEVSGGIPRICEYFATIRASDPNAGLNSEEWRTNCINYYVSRLKSLTKNVTDPDLLKLFREDISALFLRNRPLPQSSSSFATRWLSSGLLIAGKTERILKPVNSFALAAIDWFAGEHRSEFLKNLYADASTKWRAVELFFFSSLRKGNITFTGTSLRGADIPEIKITQKTLKVVEVDESFAARPIEYLNAQNGGQPYPVNTMFIPKWPTHPVSDVVLYAHVDHATSPQLVFVQISLSKYSDHNTKLSDLASVPARWEFSVFETYAKATGFSVSASSLSKIRHGKLPNNVRYVYATTSDELLKNNSKNSGHDVFLMRQANIAAMDKIIWQHMISD